jgi:two-component system OmpR family sensor kinase
VSRLGIRARFALLAAALVLMIAALVGAGGYLSLRQSLVSRAQREADDQARQLVALTDVGGEGGGGQANQVDIRDPSLTHGFARDGLLVSVLRPNGRTIQASPGAPMLSTGLRQRCLRAGHAQTLVDAPPLALACKRVGPAHNPVAVIAVGASLSDAEHALSRLAQALGIGVALGTLLAAALARLVAQRALRPARRIAQAATAIRAGDLGQRIGYSGPRDELGALADTLDASFAELEQAVERQRRFVADASHELRTPLATIQAHVELLRGWAREAPAARDAALRAIDQASRSASRLVADLLYLAQLDRLPPAPRIAMQLDQTVVDAVREAQALRPEVPIRVDRLDEAQLIADELALRQLLVNLLANALHVSPPGDEVTVKLGATGHRATITVSDRGPGIADDQLEQIFERFYTTGSHKSGNAGLGLAIAREIARRHGGDIHATSQPDGGAAFRVTLPRSETLTKSASPSS